MCQDLCVLCRTATPQLKTWQAAVLPGIVQVQQSLLAGILARVLTRGVYAEYHHCQLLAVLPLEVHWKFARASDRRHVCTSDAVSIGFESYVPWYIMV